MEEGAHSWKIKAKTVTSCNQQCKSFASYYIRVQIVFSSLALMHAFILIKRANSDLSNLEDSH